MADEEVEMFQGVFVKDAAEEVAADAPKEEEERKVNYAEIATEQRVDLLAHLRALRKQVVETRSFVEKAKEKIVSGTGASNEGVSLLQVRNHCMGDYLLGLAAFSRAKAAGESVQGPVESLVMNRCVLEKTRPLEHKLKYQLDKYADMEKSMETVLRANPAAMVDTRQTQHSDGLVAAQYQPPQVMSSLYPQAAEDAAKQARFARSTKARTKKSALMEEVAAEVRDEPVEAGRRAAQSRKVREVLKRIKENEELEEEMMQRLPMSKKDRAMMKQIEQMQGSYQSIMEYEKTPQKGKVKGKDKGKDKKKGRGKK